MDDARGQPIILPASPMFFRDREAIAQALLERRIPSITAFRENLEAGALISYGLKLSRRRTAPKGLKLEGIRLRAQRRRRPLAAAVQPPSHSRRGVWGWPRERGAEVDVPAGHPVGPPFGRPAWQSDTATSRANCVRDKRKLSEAISVSPSTRITA